MPFFFLLPKVIKICSQYISLKLGLGKIFNLYENFQSKKLSMHISIVRRGTSVHEKRWVSTFFINTTLYVVQHLTVISATTSFPIARVVFGARLTTAVLCFQTVSLQVEGSSTIFKNPIFKHLRSYCTLLSVYIRIQILFYMVNVEKHVKVFVRFTHSDWWYFLNSITVLSCLQWWLKCFKFFFL